MRGVCIWLLLSSVAWAQPETPRLPAELDLATAQQIALTHSPSLAAVAEQVAQAQAKVRQARSAYFPQVSASYTYQYSRISDNDKADLDEALEEIEDAVESGNSLLGNLILNQSGDRNRRGLQSNLRDIEDFVEDARADIDEPLETYSFNLTAQYLLFDGFGRRATLAAARLGAQEGAAGEREARRLLLEAVAQGYFAVQLARENVAVAQADIEFNTQLLEDARVLKEFGRGATSDVLNFEVGLRAAQVALLRAEEDLAVARVGLAALMGLRAGRLPEGVSVASLPSEQVSQLESPPAAPLLQLAQDYRPDLAQRSLAVARTGQQVRVRRSDYWPEVGVLAGLQDQRSQGAAIDPDDLSPVVGVGVSWDLFTGGRRRAEVAEAQAAAREAAQREAEASINVNAEVHEALTRLRKAQERLVLQRTTSSLVRRQRDLVAEEYNAAKTSLARLNQAQRDLVRADSQLAAARVALQQAWYALHTAAGTTLAAWHAGGEAPAALHLGLGPFRALREAGDAPPSRPMDDAAAAHAAPQLESDETDATRAAGVPPLRPVATAATEDDSERKE